MTVSNLLPIACLS